MSLKGRRGMGIQGEREEYEGREKEKGEEI